MKIRNKLLLLFILVCVTGLLCSSARSEYEEIQTSQGRVIRGLDKETALARFGLPSSASDEFWYFSSPRPFFVYFPTAALLGIYLYPQYCTANSGVPLEFKAFGYFSDHKVKDITSQVEFIVNEMEDFALSKPGVLIPRKAGEYEIMARYLNVFSNPARVRIQKSGEEEGRAQRERCLSINILPYRPVVSPASRTQLAALGTFFDLEEQRYFIRDISHEVNWYMAERQVSTALRNNTLIAPQSPGLLTVFCKYKNIESIPQEIEVRSVPAPARDSIKHIMVLPEMTFVATRGEITLKAYGTYLSNRFEDITNKVEWKVSDERVITVTADNKFLPESEGTVDVIGALFDVESEPVKVIVTATEELSSSSATRVSETPVKKKYSKDSTDELFKDMKEDTQDISRKLLPQEKRLKAIQLVPDAMILALGEENDIAANGIYSDGSQDDLTLFAEWTSSNDKVVDVSQGRVSTLSIGEAKIYAKFKDIISEPASVTVETARLVSIVLSPTNVTFPIRSTVEFKAEGVLSDLSRKDLTTVATWDVSNRGVLSIENGKARSTWPGRTQVYAQYSGIKSLPANVRVTVSIGWLIYIIWKAIMYLVLGALLLLALLYVITENEKRKLKSYLFDDPREFILQLYENAQEVIRIFGFRHKYVLAPLTYARLVDERYGTDGKLFVGITVKFEEAKFSRHVFKPQDALLVLKDYNSFIEALHRQTGKTDLYLKFCLALFKTKPLFISDPTLP